MNGAYEEGAALCGPFLRSLPIAGLSITLLSPDGAQSTIATSDLIAARLEEAQFELGEGPTADVLRTGQLVVEPDLSRDGARARWPLFGAAALDVGACAVFSFPLLIGRLPVGVVSLYSMVKTPSWSTVELGTAMRLAADTVAPAVAIATRSATTEAQQPGRQQTEMRREVHQAAGMVMVQLGCSSGDAMVQLRARAFSAGRPIDLIAHDIVTRTLDFTDTNE